MAEYLPEIYTRFRAAFPAVAESLDGLGETVDRAGPLPEDTQRWVKLGIAIGAQSEGAVRSNVRKVIALGASVAEVRQAALLAITTAGFPNGIAALGWVDEVVGDG